MTTTADAVRVSNSVAPNVSIGAGTKIHVGEHCIFGDCVIGKDCKIQNNVIIGDGIVLEDGVFVGPGTVFMNDKCPRARNRDGDLKSRDEWTCEATLVKHDATIGAACAIGPGVTIGEYAFVCMGSVVVHDVPAYAKVFGNPARVIGTVDEEGKTVGRPRILQPTRVVPKANKGDALKTPVPFEF